MNTEFLSCVHDKEIKKSFLRLNQVLQIIVDALKNNIKTINVENQTGDFKKEDLIKAVEFLALMPNFP